MRAVKAKALRKCVFGKSSHLQRQYRYANNKKGTTVEECGLRVTYKQLKRAYKQRRTET